MYDIFGQNSTILSDNVYSTIQPDSHFSLALGVQEMLIESIDMDVKFYESLVYPLVESDISQRLSLDKMADYVWDSLKDDFSANLRWLAGKLKSFDAAFNRSTKAIIDRIRMNLDGIKTTTSLDPFKLPVTWFKNVNKMKASVTDFFDQIRPFEMTGEEFKFLKKDSSRQSVMDKYGFNKADNLSKADTVTKILDKTTVLASEQDCIRNTQSVKDFLDYLSNAFGTNSRFLLSQSLHYEKMSKAIYHDNQKMFSTIRPYEQISKALKVFSLYKDIIGNILLTYQTYSLEILNTLSDVVVKINAHFNSLSETVYNDWLRAERMMLRVLTEETRENDSLQAQTSAHKGLNNVQTARGAVESIKTAYQRGKEASSNSKLGGLKSAAGETGRQLKVLLSKIVEWLKKCITWLRSKLTNDTKFVEKYEDELIGFYDNNTATRAKMDKLVVKIYGPSMDPPPEENGPSIIDWDENKRKGKSIDYYTNVKDSYNKITFNESANKYLGDYMKIKPYDGQMRNLIDRFKYKEQRVENWRASLRKAERILADMNKSPADSKDYEISVAWVNAAKAQLNYRLKIAVMYHKNRRNALNACINTLGDLRNTQSNSQNAGTPTPAPAPQPAPNPQPNPASNHPKPKT